MRHCWCVLNTGEPANKTSNGCHSAMGSVSFSLLLFSILGNQLRPGESGKVGRRGSRQEQIFRPLVPQLLPNYSTPALPPGTMCRIGIIPPDGRDHAKCGGTPRIEPYGTLCRTPCGKTKGVTKREPRAAKPEPGARGPKRFDTQ